MATQPTLQGVTLPWPKNPGGYSELRGTRATSVLTAGGNLIFQRLSTSDKVEFILSWVNLTDDQMEDVLGAYSLLLSTGGSNNFLSPTNTTYTVTPVDGSPPIQLIMTNTPAGNSWDATMRLRQATDG